MMWKRYGMTIAFCVVIIGSLALFYTYTGKIEQKNETLQLETIGGEEATVEDVTLRGSIRVNHIPMMMEVSLEKSDFYDFYNRYMDIYDTATMQSYVKINELQEKYKSFMRGKMNIDSFYEDETQLIYASADYEDRNTISIDLYNKESEDTTQLSVPLPDELRDSDGYMNIFDVQMLNDQLVLILDVYKKGNQTIYYVSLKGGKIVDTKSLLTSDTKENVSIRIAGNLINDTRMGPSEIILFAKDRWHEETVSNSNELYAVNLVTAEVNEVHQADNRVYTDTEVIFYDGPVLYYYEQNTLSKVSLEDSSSMILSNDVNINYIQGMREKDGNLYVVGMTITGAPQLLIIDLNQNEEIYRGEVDMEGYKDLSDMQLFDVQF